MAKLVYILCALTSVLCAYMLFRKFTRTRLPLLFWSCACFVCFALTNILLFMDFEVFPNTDLLVIRNSVNLVGLLMLIYGLIWDTI